MITLGINAAFHDSAAALVIDGRLHAAAEEERFSRIKHAKRPVPFSAWELPFDAIDFCLAQAGVRLVDVDAVAYSFDPMLFLGGRLQGGSFTLPLVQPAQPEPPWENPWDPLFASHVLNASRQLVDGVPHHLAKRWRGARFDGPFAFHHVAHHLCHQASAFLAAPFDRCAVMTLDGRGERATTAYGVYRDDGYRTLGEVQVPHSLGLLYEQVTTHLGFLSSSDEYKVMALAAQGRPRWLGLLQEHLHLLDDGQYRLDPIDLAAVAGPPRERGGALGPQHLDLAASLQALLEQAVLQLGAWLREASGERRLAMAGGVALNCVANARLRDSGLFDEVWVQPAAGDAGTALGAALWLDGRARAEGGGARGARLAAPPQGAPARLAPRTWHMAHAYWGPAWSDAQIEAELRWAKLPHRRMADPAAEVAQLLARDQVVGWFQGRMEFGPRALGARSILASPMNAAMQARINDLKDREDFRPVAPAVPEERLGEWFTPAAANGGRSPFMLFIYDVVPGRQARIPAACHTDTTARVQTVSADSQPAFHRLLTAFGELTGVPVLINTSFNVRGEPVVCSPRDAIHAWSSTPVDALVMGPFLLEKQPVRAPA
ncbi:carbamoyltransferase C-terminal domain-containing protein [Aquincola sp. MAHUQ-54]|uniref:Carbamoyltransferase C-terminal domain-containing protein n=1 Tax=Aquincola agrisoli TaxID=3119538 RepID=A0AAW9QMD9_9BURK